MHKESMSAEGMQGCSSPAGVGHQAEVCGEPWMSSHLQLGT